MRLALSKRRWAIISSISTFPPNRAPTARLKDAGQGQPSLLELTAKLLLSPARGKRGMSGDQDQQEKQRRAKVSREETPHREFLALILSRKHSAISFQRSA
jgi:hypothetical protein